ncbi:MAG: 50S ribosome-binding GTPase [Acidimicrobiia bacterium]|jgi:tRNA U34 5-carboxymethylaminomethyl modifying GTPase MnmE/TrmE
MRDRLSSLLEKADLAIASCSGVVDDTVLQPLIESVRQMRIRLAYPEDVLVVALAGGTGSGKSSLFNALVGDEVVDVGGVRPTTTHPAAAVPLSARSALDGYLGLIGIDELHPVDIEGLCLIDLPDTDSVELDHRHRVDSILPTVDLVVWVIDPEKYHDARLHHDYLTPLSAYSGQFLFVLNQIDRLSADEADQVSEDLARALIADGMGDPIVVTTSAAPPAGPPMGIDELTEALEQQRTQEKALFGKLITDLTVTVSALDGATGSAVDFDERAHEALDRASDHLVSQDVDAATSELAGFVDGIAREVGGPVGEKIERLGGDIPQHVQRIDAETTPEAPRRWFGRRGPAPARDRDLVRSRLNEAVLRPVRAVLAQRALARASVVELALDVQSLA